MASLMLETGLGGGANDASILVEIFSAVVSIFEQVFLYSLKNGLLSSFSLVAVELTLSFFFPCFDFFCVANWRREVGSPMAS